MNIPADVTKRVISLWEASRSGTAQGRISGIFTHLADVKKTHQPPFYLVKLLIDQTPESILKKYWGYSDFRPLQKDIISCAIEGKDCLALLPTGGGKSICYQVPALMMEGICLVISPLIALMRDQVQQLQDRGIQAEAIYSGMHISDIDRILDNCIYGKIKLLYLSPERLGSHLAEERIKRMHVSLIAIDEAHCVSQWGHDFRPSYLDIIKAREWHPDVPFLALTASATTPVQQDIISVLEMRSPVMIKGSFRRPNLSYLIYPREDKWQRTLDILGKLPGSKLVYTRSRSKTTQLAKLIGKQGIRCEPYHAGMNSKARHLVQQRWIEGVTGTVVCTTAFGMGIDKPDVRAVLHFDLPGSLEEYYQEAGRAGRDGKQSFCVLLHDQSDLPKLLERAVSAYPDIPDLIRVYRALCGHYSVAIGTGVGETYDLNFREFLDKYMLDAVHTFHCLQGLERDGWIMLNETIRHPSTVFVEASLEDLHDYQASHPQRDYLLKTLLRNYEGLFLEPVRIREADLAKLIKAKEHDVIEELSLIARDGIISYTPANDMPRITFIRERVEDRNLTFDTALIARLRGQAMGRAKHMEAFISADKCREQYLLAYFGEHESEPCGNCDICRSKRKGVSYDAILLRIPENGILLKELMGSFSATDQKEVRSLLSVLEADELIYLEQDLVKLNK